MTREGLGRSDVEIVMVPRERYSATLESLRHVLATVPGDVKVTLVKGGMPNRTVRRVKALARGRVEVVGPSRHLAPNAARSIGLRSVAARFVVFVDNDIIPSRGWLEALTSAAEAHDAWAVRPLILQRVRDRVTVHDAGGDCHLEQKGAVTTLVESHRHLGRTLDEAGPLQPGPTELFEFHTVLFNRARLQDVGGPDERMLSQGEHLDLALRVRSAGGSVWFIPDSQVTYLIPDRLSVRDLPFFLGRWSPSWNAASRRAFCAKHAVSELSDPCNTWRYPDFHRTSAWIPAGRLASQLLRRPIERRLAQRFDRILGRRIADAVLRLAPRWRGGGLEVPH